MTPRTQRHRAARRRFFARHGRRWPGTLADPYDILAPHVLSRAKVAELLGTVADLGRLFEKAASLLCSLPADTLRELGVPHAASSLVRQRIPGMRATVFGRFDLVDTEDGYKLLEFNADIPGLLVETFSVNGPACRDAGLSDPNEGAEQALAGALAEAVDAANAYVARVSRSEANVVVSSGPYARDFAIAAYLATLLRSRSVRARSALIEHLRMDSDGLYDPSGRRVDVLVRFVPLPFLSSRLSARHEHTNASLFDLLARRRLAVINPPSAMLLESKAVQVVMWHLCESAAYFDADDRRRIRKYMLPTYLDPPRYGPHVVKPMLGGRGDSVSVVSDRGRTVRRSDHSTYVDKPMVYQRYVDLPRTELLTELGPRKLHLLTSVFHIDGAAMGISMRAGPAITDESAWVVPVAVADGCGEGISMRRGE